MMGQATKTKNITNNLGILPINLGPAKLQKTEHTFVHYYDLNPLYREFEKLNIQYQFLKLGLKNISTYERDFENYNKILNYIQNEIVDKINNIKFHALSKKRNKRGLIDGLGTIVKTISGNLDAKDGERIDNILKYLQDSNKQIKNQLKYGYSLTTQTIKKFNDTLRSIEHNESTLKSRIMQLVLVLKGEIDHQNVLYTKDLFNQLIILYNTILNIFQNIENSISFCKLKILHSDIIRPNDLFSELQKISTHYGQQLPFELKIENIIDFESVIKVNCRIEPTRISYFLSIPINYEHDFELFYLNSIPTKHESEYVTIIPDVKYLLKSKNENKIWPLDHLCTQGIRYYQCASHLLTSQRAECEKGILQDGSNNKCQFTTLTINQNHLELLPLINQYLAVFPTQEEIKLQCEHETETKNLIGIYLIKQQNCDLFFRNQRISYQEFTLGSPTVISSRELKLQKSNFTGFQIKLKNLNLQDIPVAQQVPLDTEIPNIYVPSIWTITLYISFIGISGYIILRWTKKRKLQPQLEEPREETFRLPGDAKI